MPLKRNEEMKTWLITSLAVEAPLFWEETHPPSLLPFFTHALPSRTFLVNKMLSSCYHEACYIREAYQRMHIGCESCSFSRQETSTVFLCSQLCNLFSFFLSSCIIWLSFPVRIPYSLLSLPWVLTEPFISCTSLSCFITSFSSWQWFKRWLCLPNTRRISFFYHI